VRRGALIVAALLVAARMVQAAAAPSPAPQGEALPHALEAIDGCVARLDAEVDVGFSRIAARCPDLAPALEGGGFDRWLPRDWSEPRNELSVGGLEELRELLARELAQRPRIRTPSIERLRAELGRLTAPVPRRAGIWSGFASWLRRVGGRRADSPLYRGLAHMLRRIELAPATVRIAAGAAFAGIIALALLIIVNELRAAGVLRAFSRGASGLKRRPGALGLADSARAGPVELTGEPHLLLGAILERLSRARGLTGLRSLTVRELLGAVRLEDAESARELERLALTAERVRYAGEPVSSRELVAAVEGARSLLSKLEAR
jgi:hypothetical protein